jgi:hypothetical protein
MSYLHGRKYLISLIAALFWAISLTTVASAVDYYVSPEGNDSRDGREAGRAWKTFGKAWTVLEPGDTLYVMDGVYTEPLHPSGRNGQPGKPITVKALNDGKAVIDGQYKEIPIKLGDVFGPNGEIKEWYVLEGLVARNGTEAVLRIRGSHNVVRRFSAYNAQTDLNSHLILFAWAENNLVEDCVAAGTGRYMINAFSSDNNTIRRCFTMWDGWDGRGFCGVAWPNGNNVGVYNSSGTTVENVVAYGRALTGIFIQANDIKAKAVNNQILGSMAVLQGRDYNGEEWDYGTGQQQPTSRPGPSTCPTNIRQWTWGNNRNGIEIYGQGLVKDNLFRDVIAADNMGIGAHIERTYTPGYMEWSNNVFDRITAWNNGGFLMDWELPPRNPLGPNASNNSEGGAVITNSKIEGLSGAEYNGEGARMGFRYVDRRLTSQPLLPWPMEERIQRELGVSVNAIWNAYADLDGFGITVAPSSIELARNGSAQITVKFSITGNFAKPVVLRVQNADAGLRIEPAETTLDAPGEWTFRVTAGDKQAVHLLKIRATAEGVPPVERQVVIMVNPRKVFLPAVNNPD